VYILQVERKKASGAFEAVVGENPRTSPKTFKGNDLPHISAYWNFFQALACLEEGCCPETPQSHGAYSAGRRC